MAEDLKLAETPKDAPKDAYDDRPVHVEETLPPEVQAPLAEYRGEPPPTPQWFKDAIAREPERVFVESLGSKLEVLTWCEGGEPGLLFVHGNSAHAVGGPRRQETPRRATRWAAVPTAPPAGAPPGSAPPRAAPLTRSRLRPPQPAGNSSSAASIARRSLKRVQLPDGSGEGWTWR